MADLKRQLESTKGSIEQDALSSEGTLSEKKETMSDQKKYKPTNNSQMDKQAESSTHRSKQPKTSRSNVNS